MKKELREQARMLAQELDYFQTRKQVVNRIKDSKNEETIYQTVQFLFKLSKSRREA